MSTKPSYGVTIVINGYLISTVGVMTRHPAG